MEKIDYLIRADGLHYRILNEMIHDAIKSGVKEIFIDNVIGQRYIGCGLSEENVGIFIKGTPGNDLAAFMDGSKIIVLGNAQDGVGNTMNSGEVVICGDAGDIVGYSMRGGRIFVKGNVGYRVGIHMKAYKEHFPVIVIGGSTGDFLGEYMAGGLIVVLGLDSDERRVVGDFVGTGMHGGSIFIRGSVENVIWGREVGVTVAKDEDFKLFEKHLKDFCEYFSLDFNVITNKPFIKLYPQSHRPYGRLYAY
ncbi:MAG: hypothetical protein N3C62_04685 [Synergistetes bacterium]|nr:hypothetical protein [Synergistota bacterium]MCX8128011.1 hypothetical protein [Synergistota bacterium]MDW8192794.1 hypothetical protein [Synergistota bacterium]